MLHVRFIVKAGEWERVARLLRSSNEVAMLEYHVILQLVFPMGTYFIRMSTDLC